MKYIKYFIVFFTMILSFSLTVFAKDTIISDVTVKEISGDLSLEEFHFEEDSIQPSITFKNVGDYAIYQIFLNYDSSLYEIDNVMDNNQNRFIKTSYSIVDDKLFMMVKYDREVEGVFSLDSIKVQAKLKEKNVNPKTNQNMIWIIILLFFSLIFFLILSSKFRKKLLLFLLFIPFVVHAQENNVLEFNISTSNIKISYTVEFYKGDGVRGTMEEIECIYGETCDLPINTLVNDGSRFTGWSLEPGGEVLYLDEAQVMDLISRGKVTLYPVWKREYTIQFNGNGSTSGSMSNLVCVEGETCVLSANQFQKTNYAFSGWATSSSGSVVYSDQEEIDIQNNLSLYAKWISAITNIDYTGSVQTYTVSASGRYKLEVWGAQGGNGFDGKWTGGKGGYSYGTISLTSGTVLYIYVGQAGSTGGTISSFGGGGAASIGNSHGSYSGNPGSGGGASDVRVATDSLFARVIVAGGGGGGSTHGGENGPSTGSHGGYGGGTNGGSNGSVYGGSQTSGGGGTGSTGQFGIGAIGVNGSDNFWVGGSGGGGWYGGGSGAKSSSAFSGGGGSGYIYTSSTASNYPTGCLLNSSYYLSDASTIAGNTSFTAPDGSSETGHSGNGYARITYIGN